MMNSSGIIQPINLLVIRFPMGKELKNWSYLMKKSFNRNDRFQKKAYQIYSVTVE